MYVIVTNHVNCYRGNLRSNRGNKGNLSGDPVFTYFAYPHTNCSNLARGCQGYYNFHPKIVKSYNVSHFVAGAYRMVCVPPRTKEKEGADHRGPGEATGDAAETWRHQVVGSGI